MYVVYVYTQKHVNTLFHTVFACDTKIIDAMTLFAHLSPTEKAFWATIEKNSPPEVWRELTATITKDPEILPHLTRYMQELVAQQNTDTQHPEKIIATMQNVLET